ncbi:SpaA isopeptide-forming pilin-related protein [Vagococcus salmoninarum]|uniref:SpaA isopeptide-forming pilin-related protein n=1 Tax=Vagococcus salmoninarum TaxID=2739 RepID=UPI0028D218AD|nr:SpaA isopeptide-forming pilin-related protein [Vagococcus salmoninarum]
MTIESTISLKVDWSLPEELRKSMVGGETFSFDLAPEFKIGSGFSGNFKNDAGEPYASYTVSEEGKVVITFNDNVQDMEDIQGSFNIKTTLNEKLITKEETYTIKNPIKDKDFTIEIPVTSKTEEKIGKTGKANKDKNATAIDWTLMVNTAQKNLTNLTITDTLPTGLVIAKAEDVKIYAVSVDIKGNVIGGKELISPSEYDLDIETGQIKFKGSTNKAYQIEYQTQIEESAKPAEGGDLDFKNNVKQTSDNGKDLSTSATVGVNYGVLLNKSNGVYDPATETASWSVEYNYGEKKLNEKDSYLEDTFDESMVLVKESVKLYEQVADEKGNFSNGRELVLGTDYELVEKGSSFKVTFTKGLAHAVKMTYDTKFKDNYFVDSDTKNVKNKVTTEGGTDEGTTEGVYQNGLVKSVKDYDYTNETIDWQLTVNQSKYTMKNWKLEDIFANKGLTFLAETLEVRLNDADGEVLKAGTDYDVSPKPDKAGFDLALIGKYATTNETLYISYRTSYDKNELADKSRGFYNRAIATWTDTNDGTHKNDVGAEHKPNAETFNNGSKSGVYDAETKLITWTINVNYNRKEIIDGYISDKINGNQKYVAKSAELKEFTVDKNGNIQTGKVISDAAVTEPTAENKATLKVSLPSPSEKMGYQLTFQTSLAGEIIEKQDSYKNTAEFYTEKGLQDTLTADVTIKNGGTFATKRGNQNQENEKQADWEIRANESQSTVSGFTVIDEPSLNQVIKEETVKITEMKTDKNGDQSYTDKVLTRDEDYSLVITQDLATGQETMTISFLKEITKTYGISYSTDLLLTDGDNTLTNKVSAYGDNEKVTVENVSEKINVYYTDHDGTSSGKISEVFIRKEDDHKRKLAGVKFQLFNKAGKMVRENTTDENGLIHFANILSGTYTLKEVTRNSGYMLDKSLTEGTKEIKVVRGETNEANPLIVVNTLNEVRMQKVKEDGTPLAGAIFSLAKGNTQGQFEVLPAFQKIATNEKGELLIEGLAIGNYQLTEVEAAPGFIKNTEAKSFEITGNEIAAVDLGKFVNYQGQASLIKKDSQGTPISGAVFSLFDSKMQPLNISATANESGLVEFKNLAPGSYIVLETSAAPGYMLNKTSQSFTIVNETKGEVANVPLNDVVNYQGSAQLTKVDEAGKGLPGAVFEVLNENQEVVKDKLVSDEAGLVKVTNLAPGTYFFKEVQAPKGYILNTETYEFTIAAEAITAPAVIKVGQAVNYQGSAELVKQNQAGNPLKDAQFKVTDAKGKQVGEMLTTNREGKIFMDHLAPGTYYFEEIKAPTGYILNTEKIEFTISPEAAGEPAAVTGLELINYLGSAQLVKTNEDNLALAGATFKVETEQGQVIETDLISDKNGLVTIQDLAPGKYAFIETKAAPGHMLNETPITFEIVAEAAGQPVLVNAGSLINYQGGAQLTKVNEAGETLSEAVFSLFNEAKELIASGLTSNDKGLIEVKNLAPGNYYFEETQAPTGYVLNEEPVSFTISHEATATPTIVEVDFINYQGEIVFRKVSGDVRPRATFVDNGLAGAEFKLEKLVARSTLEAETDEEVEDVAIIKADKTGLVKVTGLAPGDYKMTEIKAPTGYITRTKVFEFTIEGSAKGRPEHAYGTEQGAVFENYQGTAELIKTNKEGQGLVGAEFKVTDEAGEAVLEGLTSDDTGKVLAENLAPGKYFFVETQAPTGYVINSSPVAFTIDEESESGRSDVTGLEMINYQGSVELSKRDQEGNPLAGAVFSIIDEQDKVVFENLVSNEAGLVSQSDIKPGTYRLIETQAPTGYIINSEPVEFTIATTSDNGHADINNLELINYQGSAQLVKKDSQNKALAGAEFKVFDANDKPVGDVLTSDEEGNITVKGLAPGTYYFEEIKAPTGYILNSEPVEFIIEKSVKGQPKAVLGLELINYQGAVELTKLSADAAQKTLAGAEFKLVDETGKVLKEKLTTDKAGKIKFTDLAPGKYHFIETKAPSGYQLDETPVPFEIETVIAGQPNVIEVTAWNTAVDPVEPLKPGKTDQSKPNNKPSNKLPQTNEASSLLLTLVGMTLVSVAFVATKRKKS